MVEIVSSRMRRSRATALLAAALVAASGGPILGDRPSWAQDDRTTSVVKTPAGYSVHTNQAELVKLLGELGGEAGFTVIDAGKFQLPVTVAIDDLPLDRTLRRLLRGTNFIIVYRGGKRGVEIPAEGIEQIILLSPAGAGPPVKVPASPLSGAHVANVAHNGPPAAEVPAARARRLRAGGGAEPGSEHQSPIPPQGPGGAAMPNIPVPPEMAGMSEIPGIASMPGQHMAVDPMTGVPGAVGAAVIEEYHPPFDPDDATLDDDE